MDVIWITIPVWAPFLWYSGSCNISRHTDYPPPLHSSPERWCWGRGGVCASASCLMGSWPLAKMPATPSHKSGTWWYEKAHVADFALRADHLHRELHLPFILPKWRLASSFGCYVISRKCCYNSRGFYCDWSLTFKFFLCIWFSKKQKTVFNPRKKQSLFCKKNRIFHQAELWGLRRRDGLVLFFLFLCLCSNLNFNGLYINSTESSRVHDYFPVFAWL